MRTLSDKQQVALAELRREQVGSLAFRQSDRDFAETMSRQISRVTPHMGDAGDDDCLTPHEAAMVVFGVSPQADSEDETNG